MQTVNSRRATTGQMKPDLFVSVWKDIRDRLDKERARIFEEIRNYPTPIIRSLAFIDAEVKHAIRSRLK